MSRRNDRSRWLPGLAVALTLAAAAGAEPFGAPAAMIEQAAQRVRLGEHLEAINLAEAAIDRIERRGDRYAAELAPPLLVLGDALAGVGDSDGAFGAYDRARHIVRINRGLHDPSQIEAVYREAALFDKLGRKRSANQRHEYAYGILLRAHGADSPDMLPGIFMLADWYKSIYGIFDARALYAHGAALARKHLPPADPSRIRALRGIAATYRDERFPPLYSGRKRGDVAVGSGYAGFEHRSSPYNPAMNSFGRGERALIEVVSIRQTQGAGDEALAAAMLELGDWFLMFEKYRRAASLYRRVWELLQENPALRDETFGAPTPLYMPLPAAQGASASASIPGAGSEGIVELAVDVNTHGFVSRIDTLRAEPDDEMEFRVRRAVKRARYRPVFDGRQWHPARGIRVVHAFPRKPTASVDPAAAARHSETLLAPAGLTIPSGT